MGRYKITDLSIALVDDQRALWSQEFGYPDLAGEIYFTGNKIHPVGSISMVSTFSTVMKLAEQGTIARPLS